MSSLKQLKCLKIKFISLHFVDYYIIVCLPYCGFVLKKTYDVLEVELKWRALELCKDYKKYD